MTNKYLAHKAVSKWFAYQNEIELEFALNAVEKFKPKVILEIGTAFNSSIACWCEVAKPDLAIGIDPLTLPKTKAQQKVFDDLKKKYNLQIIQRRSEDPEAQKELLKILDGRKVDFLFIDGEHLYEYVSWDYRAYIGFMNEPSLIGFHDIYYSKQLFIAGTGVWRVWEELKARYNYDEIHFHSSMGIGFIYYPEIRKDNI